MSMANNHGADYGSQGCATPCGQVVEPIPIVGIGADEDDAFAPATLTAKGLRVAVFGASQVFEMTLANWSADAGSPGIASASPVTRLRSAVQRAARTHDLVVVFMHWGLDYQQCRLALGVHRAPSRPPAPTSWWAVTRTASTEPAGWGGRASPTAWATSCGGAAASRTRAPGSCASPSTSRRPAAAPASAALRRGSLDPDAHRGGRHTEDPREADTVRLQRLWDQAGLHGAVGRTLTPGTVTAQTSVTSALRRERRDPRECTGVSRR